MNSINYIKQNLNIDALPSDVQKDYFNRFWAGEPGMREELITHNIHLVIYAILAKYYKFGNDLDDLFSLGLEALIIAVDTFNDTKGCKFSTYALHGIFARLYNYIRHKYYLNSISYETLYVDASSGEREIEDAYEEKELIANLNEALATLSPVNERVIRMTFGLDNTEPIKQKQIGKILGYSQAEISRKKQRSLARLARVLK